MSTRSRHALRVLVVAVCTLLSGVRFISSGPSESIYAWSESVSAPLPVSVCELRCHEWPYECDYGEHFAHRGLCPWNAVANGGQHNSPPCYSGWCDEKHGPLPCDPLPELTELRNA